MFEQMPALVREFGPLAESVGAVMREPNEVSFKLTRHRNSVPRARALLHAVLGEWRIDQDVLDDTELVLSELVTNALRVRVPTGRQVGVRIARSVEDGLLRLEVSDAGAGEPEVQVPGEDETGGRGLMLVEALAHRWGVEKRKGGIGKTVWAELTAPAVPPTPAQAQAESEAEVAAALVLPGQCVRVWGTWHSVRTARGEVDTAGKLSVVFELDEGPAMRFPSREPLIVRTGGVPSAQGAMESAGVIIPNGRPDSTPLPSHAGVGTEPVAELAARPKTQRTGRGSLRGQIHLANDFNEPSDDLADTFGTPDGGCDPTPNPLST
jgi:anti-sigma regulatory factor (Ser/Thr protein kinase)